MNKYFSDAASVHQNNLVLEVARALGKGIPVNLIFDYDGTLSPFHIDPAKAVIDPECLEALHEIAASGRVKVSILTGREVDVAANFLRKRDGDLPFTITGSHGVEHLETGGSLVQYRFTPEEQKFVAAIHDFGHYMQDKYHGITIEIKHGVLGVNAGTLPDITRKTASEEAMAFLTDIISSDANPVTGTGQQVFDLVQESGHEMEIRPSVYGKDFGIRYFIKPARESLTIFFGDSFGETGTDRPAAEYIKANGGKVVMVMNGRIKVPEKNDPAAPDMVFQSPSDLGASLRAVSAMMKNYGLKTCPRHDPQPP